MTDVTLDGEAERGKAYAYIYTADEEDPVQLLDGQHIRFSGKVYHPYPKENEYDFDYPMWMRQNGYRYGITSIQDLEILPMRAQWADYAQRIASICREKLTDVMGDQADLAVAMLLGDTGGLAEDDYAAFQRAGVAHIMAVSGLHVGILSMALLWLLTRLHLRKGWQIAIVAVFLLFYCGVTGFAVSSVRAAVMVLLWAVGGALGRKPNPITVVSAAALIVLIINPLQLFSAGFALSFSAVAGILLLYPRFMQGLDRVFPPLKAKRKQVVKRFFRWFMRKFKQILAVSLSAQLGVLLPIAAYFHYFYPYSILFNLLIVPIVGVLVPLYALTAVAVFIPWVGGYLGAVFGAVAGFGSDVVLRLVRVSGTLPLAEIRMAQPNAWVFLASFVSAVAVSHFVRASVRRRLMAILTVIAIAAAGSVLTSPPSLRYHQLSVGWADSALIIDGGTTIGIDTGDTGSEMSNRLLAEGRDLDALILTHLHSDHAGGVEKLLDNGIRIEQVYIPVDYELHGYSGDTLAILQRLEADNVPVTTLKAGDTLSFHETTIDVLWPQEGHTREGIDPNDRSMALLMTLGGVRLLHMADNGMLYERYAAVPADILKVGHHGSSESTGENFLETVRPTLAIISVRSSLLPLAGAFGTACGTGHLDVEHRGCWRDYRRTHGRRLPRLPVYRGGNALNYLKFFETLKNEELKSVYLFEGEEEYIKAQAVKTLCKRLLPDGLEQMNLTELVSPAADELIASAETLPVMADKRVVLARDFAPLSSAKSTDDGDAERMIEYLDAAPPFTCLVFLVKGKADRRRKLYTYCNQKHTVVDFSPMTEPQAVDWIIKSMRALGKKISSAAAERFLFTVGNDAALLKQEIEKLADYTGERDTVTEDDIAVITVQSLESTVFQMVDAQVAGNYGEAFLLMHRLLESGEDRMMILAMLLRQYRMLYQMRCLLEEKTSQGELASLLKIPPFAVRRMQSQSMRYGKEQLKAVYDFLLDFEYRLKSGRLPQDGCAEAALMQMKELLDHKQG